MYASGAVSAGNLEINPSYGMYRYDMQVKNSNWLKDSIKPRMDRVTGRSYPIKPLNNGLHQYRANSKDNVTRMNGMKINPDMIREMSRDQQNSWLNGYLDAKMTVDVKGKTDPLTRIVERNPERLMLARDLLKQNDIQAKVIPESKELGPHLQIIGLGNHQKLQDNLKLENPTVLNRLDNLLQNPSRFEGREKQINNKLGLRLERNTRAARNLLRPNTSDYQLKDPKNAFGKDMKPDMIRQHSDGKIEAIDVKLISRIESKDKNYLSNNEIDFLTIAYWEGKEKNTKSAHGKPINYESLKDFRDNLQEKFEKSQSKEERNSLNKFIQEYNKIENELKNNNEKDKDSKEEVIEKSDSLPEKENDSKEELNPSTDSEADERLSSYNNSDIRTTDDITNANTDGQNESSNNEGAEEGTEDNGEEGGGGGGSEHKNISDKDDLKPNPLK